MGKRLTDSCHGWNINVDCGRNPGKICSFDVTDPDGNSHHVHLEGENVDHAPERARELIDLEPSFMRDS